MFTCEIDGLDHLVEDWHEALGLIGHGINRGVERGVTEGAEQARSSHPYQDRTGALTGSIRGYLERSAVPGAGGEAIGVIEARKRYASFVEGGTEPHEIRARRAKALHFEVDGGEVFARRVHHPGTQPHPYIGPAVLKAERVIEAAVDVAVEDAADVMDRS